MFDNTKQSHSLEAVSFFKRVEPTDNGGTAKAATTNMDALQHPVSILRHLPALVPDFRSQVPPDPPLQTSGPALLPNVGPALLIHLDHRLDPVRPPGPPLDASHLILLLPPALPALLLPAAALLVFPLCLWCGDAGAAAADQLCQAHRLFPCFCHRAF